MTFGQKFKARRIEMGLTQEQFANEFNKRYNYSFNKSTISNYENDLRTPEMNVIIKLAEMMNISVDYLLGIKKEDVNLDEFEVAFHGEVKDLSDDAKEKVLEYARLLKMKEDSKK